MSNRGYHAFTKRVLDLALVIPALLLLSPVAAIVWVCVRLALGSPAIFRQTRIGLNQRPFTVYKFRTMTDTRTADGALAPDEQRLTRFGRFLRASSLDEIPQLWNVLKGDMSLVGPRPLLPEYLGHYSEEQNRRHLVRPGITGWAQVNGRNDVSWEDRFERDVWYVDNSGLLLDLRILFLTVSALVSRRGVSHKGCSTMPRFDAQPPARRPVLVLGGGGHAKVVVSTIQAAGYSVEAVLDDDPRKWGETLLGVPIRGPIHLASQWPDLPAVVAIGDNELRRALAERLNCNWMTVVHPTACVHATVRLGEGSVVFAGVVLQPDVAIGKHSIVNTASSIDHDCIVEDYCHVGPGSNLGGNVRLRSGAFLGCGAKVIPGICVGANATVGAGAVVIRNVADGIVAVGNPAVAIKRKSAA